MLGWKEEQVELMEWDPCIAVVVTLEHCLCSQLETKVGSHYQRTDTASMMSAGW